MSEPPAQTMLKREIGVFGAMMMGLGSIIGTGVFVSIGIAAGVTGPSVVLATLIAALVATCNGLSSAQLAASHPVSGGTYEYGYRWLTPLTGFTAGWMFVCAKSASAATAALGFAGYALHLFGQQEKALIVPIALGVVALVTLLVWGGIRRSNHANIAIVSVTLLALACFVFAGLPAALRNAEENLNPFFVAHDSRSAAGGFLEACALMFVAFTGYGRIATLGEEVTGPQTTIPRAIIVTLIVSSLVYIAVGVVGVSAAGSSAMAKAAIAQAAPLEVISRGFGSPFISTIIAAGAITAMLGVLLNLVLGLSRVVLAMGRRGDLPRSTARLDKSETTPVVAVPVVGLIIAALTMVGNVKSTWSFSAFTVLIYYALTNLAATRLTESERMFPRLIPWAGFLSCLALAFWVEPQIWRFGLLLILAGILYRWAFRRWFPPADI